jgi:hypothetical protein
MLPIDRNLPASNFFAGCELPASELFSSAMPLPARQSGLIARAQHGEREAYLLLFEEHGKSVHSMSRRLMENEAAAESLTRDVFVETFRRLHSIRDEDAFASYVRRSVTEKAMKKILGSGMPSIAFKPSITTDLASAEPGFSI